MWFDAGGALQVAEDASARAAREGFASVPGLLDIVADTDLAPPDDDAATATACELVLEALVARRRLSRSDTGAYGRATHEPRRRPGQDLFGGGLSA